MNWKNDALVHAKDQDPKEAVGLLLNIRGKEKYYPCRNIAITNHQDFILDPEDYVKADNLGEITAVVHSHPATTPQPSQADRLYFAMPSSSGTHSDNTYLNHNHIGTGNIRIRGGGMYRTAS